MATGQDGDPVEVGRIQLVQFTNPRGLESTGDGLYRQTVNSGDIAEGFPGDEGFAGLAPRGVEGSNVDISSEFTSMIIAQRAYQANTRAFSIGDEMISIATDITR
ncbi:MAG: flagellar hook-basal body complex protein [Dehalococcoidia bacterium]|nr:flagellar hook-basal body complex protein [Dehalococcoidia bacterium]